MKINPLEKLFEEIQDYFKIQTELLEISAKEKVVKATISLIYFIALTVISSTFFLMFSMGLAFLLSNDDDYRGFFLLSLIQVILFISVVLLKRYLPVKLKNHIKTQILEVIDNIIFD